MPSGAGRPGVAPGRHPGPVECRVLCPHRRRALPPAPPRRRGRRARRKIGYSLPDDVDDALDAAERHVFDLTEDRVRAGTLTDASVVLAEFLRDLGNLVEHPGELLGVPTGYTDLDDRLLGLQPSKLTVVAARPAVGKPAFALGAAVHVATRLRRPVVLFSLEMGRSEIAQRMVALRSGVDSRRLRAGKGLSDDDWARLVTVCFASSYPFRSRRRTGAAVAKDHQ